jgi:hypothetical protein
MIVGMEKTKQQLQVEVGKIQQKVEQVKTLQNTSEKQHQMKLVEKEISVLKQEIERSALQDNEKHELLSSLDDFSSDLERLKQRVLENPAGKDKEPSNPEPNGFRGKAKGIFL